MGAKGGALWHTFGYRLGNFQWGDRCPEGWTQLNNRCYIFIEKTSPFDIAQESCEILGGDLVSIQNDMELAVVNELAKNAIDLSDVWIGLSVFEVGSVMWTDGSDTDFAKIELIDLMPGGCVAIDTSDIVWKIVDCDSPLPYICARDVFQCALICKEEDQVMAN
nr:dromaiocalcin-2-like [Nerophis lumbriciformis]